MSDVRSTSTRRSALARVAAVIVGAGLLVGTASGVASAKEVGSGGTPVTATCSPVKSLGYKGDTSTSDTSLATISVTYSVKACTSGQSVIVDTKMYETANPSVVVYDNPAAPLSGKFTVGGVRSNFSYRVTVTVTDATTGAVVGSQSIYAAAIYKGV